MIIFLKIIEILILIVVIVVIYLWLKYSPKRIAIEFAKQAVANKIDSKEKIPLAELEKFHIKKSDGGVHIA